MNVLSVLSILLAALLVPNGAGTASEDSSRHLAGDVSADDDAIPGNVDWRMLEMESLEEILIEDAAMRAVVCRVPFIDFTLKRLTRATKISQKKLKDAIEKLDVVGLVATSGKGGAMRISPANEEARDKLRSLAREYCTSDDECGVAK